MIINTNIVGNEAMPKLADIASQISQEFYDEIPRDNVKAAQATMIVYGMLAMNIVSMLMTNRAMNDMGADVVKAEEYLKTTIVPDWVAEVTKICGFNFEEIKQGTVKETRFDKGVQ